MPMPFSKLSRLKSVFQSTYIEKKFMCYKMFSCCQVDQIGIIITTTETSWYDMMCFTILVFFVQWIVSSFLHKTIIDFFRNS